jgi:hypothetical protein
MELSKKTDEAARKTAPLDESVSEGLFDVADLLLNLAADLLNSAVGFHVGIVRRLTDLFLDGALHIVGSACDLVLTLSAM